MRPLRKGEIKDCPICTREFISWRRSRGIGGVEVAQVCCSKQCHAKRMQALVKERFNAVTEKQCGTCGETKPIEEFRRTGTSHHRRRCCKDCQPRGSTESQRRSHLRSKFGMSLETWTEVFQYQGGCCVICKIQLQSIETIHNRIATKKTPWKNNNWSTDHCHATGKVRGILCRHCNVALGALRDNPEIALSAALYLEQHKP